MPSVLVCCGERRKKSNNEESAVRQITFIAVILSLTVLNITGLPEIYQFFLPIYQINLFAVFPLHIPTPPHEGVMFLLCV